MESWMDDQDTSTIEIDRFETHGPELITFAEGRSMRGKLVAIIGALAALLAVFTGLYKLADYLNRLEKLEGYHANQSTVEAQKMTIQQLAAQLKADFDGLRNRSAETQTTLSSVESSVANLQGDLRDLQGELRAHVTNFQDFRVQNATNLERIRGDIRLIEKQRIILDIGGSKSAAAKAGYIKQGQSKEWVMTDAGTKLLGEKLLAHSVNVGMVVREKGIVERTNFDKIVLAELLDEPGEVSLLREATLRHVTLHELVGTMLCYAYLKVIGNPDGTDGTQRATK